MEQTNEKKKKGTKFLLHTAEGVTLGISAAVALEPSPLPNVVMIRLWMRLLIYENISKALS